MRPFQIILLTVFGVLALVGLFLFANFSGFGDARIKVGAVTIWGTLPETAMQQNIGALKTAQQQYAKVTYVEKSATTFDRDLADAIAAGTGPDLILISQEQLAPEENKLNIIPYSSMPQRTFLNTYLPIDELFLTPKGTYALPYVVDPLVLYYSRPMLTSAGAASPPANWEAAAGLAQNISRVDQNQNILKSAFALGTYSNIEHARAIISLLLLQSGDPISYTSDVGVRSALARSIVSADGSSLAPAQAALNFYTQFANPAKTIYSWNRSLPSARQAFLSGDLAFYFGYASELADLKASNPNLDFDMAPVPQPATAPKKVGYALAYAFAIPKASHNAAGAYRAAIALGGGELIPSSAAVLGMVPAQRSLLAANPSDRYSPVYYPQALIASGWLSPGPAITDSIFSTMIDNISTGRTSVENALYFADQALTSSYAH